MDPLAHDFAVHAAAPAPRPPARGRAASFAAPTRHGPIALELHGAAAEASSRLPDSVRAAALLAGAEPLLQWLEDWIGEPLDPAPAGGAADTPPRTPSARLHWRWGDVDAVVDVPWAALATHRPAPEVADFWRDAVRWEAVEVQVVLAREALTDDEWQALQRPGAGWLMRDAFTADGSWPCALRLREDGFAREWPARWWPARRRLQWDEAAPAGAPGAAADEDGVQAVLAQPLRLAPPALLGWHEDGGACDCPADQAVAVLAPARHGGRRLHAQLMPVGLRLSVPPAAGPAFGAVALQAGWVLRVDAAIPPA
jgi:hypothetical protein